MFQRIMAVFAIVFCAFPVTAQDKRSQPPKPDGDPISFDSRLVIERFATAPEIVHPIALDFDSKGRLLVVESHTHFRPAKYDGPKYDRIRLIVDTDGDGKADKFTTFFEETTHTMDLAVHPDGSVYVATRNEILRLRDPDNDGKADEKTRIAFLDTKGNYPHNGLCGLSFDSRGDLSFGMGENLGAAYKLIGSDGITLAGGGEGGNFYHCTADGKKLRRIATGFWNPFGSCRDIFGRLFVVDNDPDASPPCRLLHVVEGADFGFQFRYGRAGRHPFQAWNGELPGTLPMVAGTGESPCEVISYESDGLPAEYRGDLLVPAWADHRIERYVLKPNGASFSSERKPFIQGGKEFRPSGLTVAPDGSLFVTDWVSEKYELHGKGAIWRVRWKDAIPAKRPADPKEAILSAHRPTRDAAARTLVKDESTRAFLRKQLSSKDVRVQATALEMLILANDEKTDLAEVARGENDVGIRAMAVRGLATSGKDVSAFGAVKAAASLRAESLAGKGEIPLLQLLADPDPFLRHAAIQRAARDPRSLKQIVIGSASDSKQRIGLLLAYRAAGEKEGTGILHFVLDRDADVRLLAAKWVSDEKLTEYRPHIVELLKNPALDPRGFLALTTTLARLDDKPANEDSLATYFLDRLNDRAASVPARLMALRAVPATHAKLRTEQFTELLQQDDPLFRVEVLRALKDRGDGKAATAVRAIARDAKQPVAVRAQALVTLSAITNADMDLFLEMASGPETALRHEALRALVNSKLSQGQMEKLTAGLKGNEDSADLLQRLGGKALTANRPAAKEIDAWLVRLDGPADAEAGRRIFEHPKLAACFKCHQVDGRGANVGPDLSLIGRTERRWIVESLLQPSSSIAPHYQAWKIVTIDERTRTGLLVRTYLDESEYIDEKGNRFKVLANDLVEVTSSRLSIMPEGLVDSLTDQEIRDLVAYLQSRK